MFKNTLNHAMNEVYITYNEKEISYTGPFFSLFIEYQRILRNYE